MGFVAGGKDMKGLLFKDLYIGRKMIYIGTVIFVLIEVMIYVVRFSFIYGNPANPEWLPVDEYTVTVINIDMVFTMLTVLCPIVILSNAVTVSLYSDFNCKWNTFLYSAPYNEKNIVGLKFAEMVVSWILGVAVGMLFNGIYDATFSESYTSLNMLLSILVSFVGLIIELLYLKMSYKYKSQNAVIIRLIIYFAVPIYVISTFAMIKLIDYLPKKYLGNDGVILLIDDMSSCLLNHAVVIFATTVVVTLIVGYITYRKSILEMKRREKVCGA
jgi:hypothetical protein